MRKGIPLFLALACVMFSSCGRGACDNPKGSNKHQSGSPKEGMVQRAQDVKSATIGSVEKPEAKPTVGKQEIMRQPEAVPAVGLQPHELLKRIYPNDIQFELYRTWNRIASEAKSSQEVQITASRLLMASDLTRGKVVDLLGQPNDESEHEVPGLYGAPAGGGKAVGTRAKFMWYGSIGLGVTGDKVVAMGCRPKPERSYSGKGE